MAITSKSYLSLSILGDAYGLNCKVFDRSVNHEYTHKIPGRVCWVGDYATEPDDFNFNLPAGIVRPNYKKVWGNRVTYLTCHPSDFTLDDKFLINYDTKEYLDLNEYRAASVDKHGWTIHPLPSLTPR